MEDNEWNLIRKVTYWTLQDLDKQIELPPGRSMPTNMSELDDYARDLTFELRLDKTLELTSEALKEVAKNMDELHRVAAAVRVNAPSAEEIAALQADLQTISEDLKGDQRFKAGVAIAGSLAGIIGKLKS
jgi:hypothetical protein